MCVNERHVIQFVDSPIAGRRYVHILVPDCNKWMGMHLSPDGGEVWKSTNEVNEALYIDFDDNDSIAMCNQMIAEIKESIKIYGIRNNALTRAYTPTQKEEVWWVSVANSTSVKQISIQHNDDTKPLNVENYNYYKDKGTAWRLAELIKFMFVSYGMPLSQISIK